ncbi:MAG TPA: hypothetical protein VLA72_17165 [Anaerolineales bacterium]|nr:hypothetical protein [Anaerolineales bacterium]
MKNLLIFTTATGKNQLRGYVKVALGLFVILVVLLGVNAYNRKQMVSDVMAAPRPLDAAFIPVPTDQVVEPVAQVEECSSNPADWTLTENRSVPGSNLKGLSPHCAYDQLDRTAAWFYATYVLGHSRSDAANLLGFSNIPISYSFGVGQISVLTDYKDKPQKVDLRFPSNNSGLSEWRINASGQPAVEFTFSGCFRTSSLSGGEVVSWGDGYPVVCQYSGDFQTKHYIGSVNDNVVTASGTENVRRFMWFGYAGDGDWVFLGIAKDWEFDLSQIQNHETSTINPTSIVGKYDIRFLPLPENWTAFTGQDLADAFLKELRESN